MREHRRISTSFIWKDDRGYYMKIYALGADKRMRIIDFLELDIA